MKVELPQLPPEFREVFEGIDWMPQQLETFTSEIIAVTGRLRADEELLVILTGRGDDLLTWTVTTVPPALAAAESFASTSKEIVAL